VLEEGDWRRLIDQLSNGACTPIIGPGAVLNLYPTGTELSMRWAGRYHYPFPDKTNLARVLDYATVTAGDPVYVKEMMVHDLIPSRTPDFSDPVEPHGLLAKFPISVYLTTNYDDFMAQALASSGKMPHSAVCPWYSGDYYDREELEAVTVQCNSSQPLVYHLHGSVHSPKSLVLTEGDYLNFLVRITRSNESSPIIPRLVLSALVDNPLLFIGYIINDWTFRVLFHGLLQGLPEVHRRRSTAVMLLPPIEKDVRSADYAARYITRYLDNWRIIPYWGTVEDFCRELHLRMDQTS
jgi:hypothetical protein